VLSVSDAGRATSQKAALRASALACRNGLGERWRAEASARITAGAWPLVEAAAPSVVSAYLPRASECDPRGLIGRARGAGMTVVLPAAISGTAMVFRRYDDGAPLAAGGFGTLAPTPDMPVLDPDLMLVPLVAFDRTGGRLGNGRGFYDRALAAMQARGVTPKLVGIAFSVQEVRSIPVEPHDMPLDRIVTEKETIIPGGGK